MPKRLMLLFFCSLLGGPFAMCPCWTSPNWMSAARAADTPNGTDTPEEAAQDSAEILKSVDVNVLRLGAAAFADRRAAFLDIWHTGKIALPAVQAAKQSADPQVAQAAAALEALFLLDVSTGDIGSEVFEFLIQPSPDSVLLLCERENWKLAAHLLKTNAELNLEFKNEDGRQYLNQVVELALAQGDPMLAWPVVQQATLASDEQQAGLSQWLAMKLEINDLALDNAVPPTSVAKSPVTTALDLIYAGRSREALELAIPSSLRQRIYTRHLPWEELKGWEKTRREDLFGRLVVGSGTPAFDACIAVLYELAGDFEESDVRWHKILEDYGIEPPTDESDPTLETESPYLQLLKSASPFDQEQLLMALIVAGKVEPVEQFLKVANANSAFGFYTAANNYRAAFELVGLEADLGNFNAWLDDQEQLIRSEVSRPGRGREVFDIRARVCNFLVGLGHRERAKRLLDVLADQAAKRPDLWAGSIIRWMGRAEARELCLAAVQQRFGSLASSSRREILQGLFPEFAACVVPLAQTAPNLGRDITESSGVIYLLDHLHRWDNQFFESARKGEVVRNWLIRTERKLIADQTPVNQPRLFSLQLGELAQLAAGCGIEDLALELAEVDLREYGAPNSLSQSHWIEAAKIHLASGQPQEAADLLGRVRRQAETSNNQAALIEEIRALLLTGEYAAAVKLDRSRWLRPLAVQRLYYEGTAYAHVASDFIEESEYETARDYAELAFALSEFSSVDVHWAASDLATILEETGDYQRGAQVLRTPLLESLQRGSPLLQFLCNRNYHSSLRAAAQRSRLHSAVACIENQQFAAAERHIRIGQVQQPQDIEMVVQCYPRLIDQQQEEFAERIFKLFEDTMLAQIETWPNDAMALNNLAWMYSQCDRKLEDALVYSDKAVSIAPSSAVYIDTLAEIHYRSGRLKEATKAMLECVRLDPRDKRYRENLIRFRTPATD